MAPQYEIKSKLEKKNERIVRALVDKTKGHQLFWREVLGSDVRTYQTEDGGMNIEFRTRNYILDVDFYGITGDDVSISLLEELDSEIQLKLKPHTGSSHPSRVLSLEQQADRILDLLKA